MNIVVEKELKQKSIDLIKTQIDYYSNQQMDLKSKIESLERDLKIERGIAESIKNNGGNQQRFEASFKKSLVLFIAFKEAHIELDCVSLCIDRLKGLLNEVNISEKTE